MKDYERLTKEDLEILNDLYERLVLDYAGDKQFKQLEEDRLVIGRFIDKIESGKWIELPCIRETKSKGANHELVYLNKYEQIQIETLDEDEMEYGKAKLAELRGEK